MDILGVDAKFEYDDRNPVQRHKRVIVCLEYPGTGFDAGAVRQQWRRLAEIGEWREFRTQE
ncbi:MAG: hypothetical protein M0Z92_11730 [Actinomycetota bacterium]|nr:hypothetical protein [Actinomycetota bacterium]